MDKTVMQTLPMLQSQPRHAVGYVSSVRSFDHCSSTVETKQRPVTVRLCVNSQHSSIGSDFLTVNFLTVVVECLYYIYAVFCSGSFYSSACVSDTF